jgi:hypothetical protein
MAQTPDLPEAILHWPLSAECVEKLACPRDSLLIHFPKRIASCITRRSPIMA